jgi:hypothetical protein
LDPAYVNSLSRLLYVLGQRGYQGDLRQFGGVLFALSICATFYPMADLSSLVGPDDSTADTGLPLSSLIGAVFVIAIGLSGMLVGYLQVVHDYSHVLLTAWVLVIVQTAWISYITAMVDVGKAAAKGSPMFGLEYDASDSAVWFYGAMGILGIIAYGFCFLGGLAFVSFALFAYQTGKPGERNGGYFRGRLRIYAFMVFIAGLAQLMLGAYTINVFSNGPLVPAIDVAMFTISYPEISVAVGIVYVMNGLWGVYRTFTRPTDDYYQMSLALQWFLTISLTILTQIAYQPGASYAAAAPSRSCLMIGASLMPALLDYKARHTPEELDGDYYGLNSVVPSDEKGIDQEDPVMVVADEQPLERQVSKPMSEPDVEA